MTDVRLTATNPEDSSVVPVACNAKGELKLEEPIEPNLSGYLQKSGGDMSGDLTFSSNAIVLDASDGVANFAGYISSGDLNGSYVAISGPSGAASYFDGSSYKWSMAADGSCSFAGNKAGFTANGELWCTTSRGDTVILDATSNGLGSWQPYEPPGRKDLMEAPLKR